MKIDAISVTSLDMKKSVAFYAILGFKFPPIAGDEKHIEPMTDPGEVRLMIDDAGLIESIIGKRPVPPTHSSFAMLCKSPAEVDAVFEQVKSAGFTLIKDPWDAFWGQRYAIVADPDGYMVDLFAPLPG